MRVEVCTLFEKQYHLGVAVLVNSLARRGLHRQSSTPAFAARCRPGPRRPRATSATTWELPVPGGPRIVFIEIETDAHFTNYKPEFMLQAARRARRRRACFTSIPTSWSTSPGGISRNG